MSLSNIPPSKRAHILHNGTLVLLSVLLWPTCTVIAILSQLIAPHLAVVKHIQHHRRWRQVSSSTFRPRTVLVTGVGMSKGLALARIFYRAGHRVIGADFEPYLIPVAGHFSTSIEVFYRLSPPTTEKASLTYIRDLIDIIKKEKIELWVSCPGEDSTIIDGEAAEAIEKETRCKAVQFGPGLTATLHEKHSFITHTARLHLSVPETHLVTSETEALVVLYPQRPLTRSFIMKSVRFDGPTHADMTILPQATVRETEQQIKRLGPTPFRPFVLQEHISGPEYCTHALLVKGEIRAFVVCPSANLLMHYQPLPTSSALAQAMLLYTTLYVQRTGSNMTGHFCLDFLVDEGVARAAEARVGASQEEIHTLMRNIKPIECNPRPNTAVLCLSDMAEDLADAYLSHLSSSEPKSITNGHRMPSLIVPKPDVPGYYWIGHDLVTRVLLPTLSFLRFEIGVREVMARWMEFVAHVLYWREGVWEVWDPWPAWWFYVGYWPLKLLVAMWEGRCWSRLNITTGKMFGC